MHSFWTDGRGYVSVSLNENLPLPVVGYLIPAENGWTIEGDEPQTIYPSKDEAAQVLLDRYPSR
jgi:hypothetical protein